MRCRWRARCSTRSTSGSMPPRSPFSSIMAAPRLILVDPEFAGVIAEALTLMTGPKPFVIDVDDSGFRRRQADRRDRIRRRAVAGRSGFVARAAARRMGRDCAELYLGHHGQSQGRRHPSSRRLSQCRQQHPGRQSRPASGLSLDAADVPLQRLVLSVDHRGDRGHQRLPAQGRSCEDFRADRESTASPTCAARRSSTTR